MVNTGQVMFSGEIYYYCRVATYLKKSGKNDFFQGQ